MPNPVTPRTGVQGLQLLPAVIRLVRDQRSPGHAGSVSNDSAEWETLGTFVIEFQQRTGHRGHEARRTLAHHMESGESSEWKGIVDEALLSWMLGRLFRSDDGTGTPFPLPDPHD